MRMKLILLFISLFNFILLGQDVNSLFHNANKYYQIKDYDKALVVYNKIYRQGYVGSELFYNMGNSYFRTDKLGYAILFYEKAIKISPSDDDIQFNLKFARAKTIDKIDEVPKIFLTVWWEYLVSIFNYTGWALLIIINLILFLIALGIYFISKKLIYRKYGFYFASVLFAIMILNVIIFYNSFIQETNTDYGILTVEMTIVKQAPDLQSNDAFIIHEGIKFSFEDRVNNWSKIKLSDGKVGWIENSAFQKI